MILLLDTDEIRIVTSTSADLDVHASCMDKDGSDQNPNRDNTTISSATTTVVVDSPAAGQARGVKTLTARNRDATDSVVVTVVHHDGSLGVELFKATLYAGESLDYNERLGWRVMDYLGNVKQASFANAHPPSMLGVTTVVLASDVTNNDASANTIADVTGLSFPVVAGNTYWFRFVIAYTAAATTTGSRWSINGPATPTLLNYYSTYTLAATTQTQNHATAYDMPAASNASSLAAGNIARIEGIITPSGNGDVIARFASEISSSAIVAKAGSVLNWQQVA